MKKVSKKLIYIPSSRSESDIDIPSNTLLYDSNEYQLFYIQKKTFYCRHLRTNSAWFESFSNENSFTEVTFDNFYDFAFQGTWDFAVLEKQTLQTTDHFLNLFRPVLAVRTFSPAKTTIAC